MQIYRRLAPIKAISFDLDDTLYSNYPIMVEANKQMVAFFSEHLPKGQDYDLSFWYDYRNAVIKAQPELKHDVVAVRLAAYTMGIKALGFSTQESTQLAKRAMAHFVEHRSNFTVPDEIHRLLKILSESFPLASISNGNVDVDAIGLSQYFSYIYHAGDGLKQKPDSDMFERASKALGVENKHILHVGDCGFADIHGAIDAGFQTAYLPKYGIGKALKQLPHIWLNDVDELRALLVQ